MSLLALMNRNKEVFKAVAPKSSMFYCPDGSKPFSKDGLRVESKLTSPEAGLVGNAFDYLLRAQVARWTKDQWEDTVFWWATFGMERLMESIGKTHLNSMIPYSPEEKDRWIRYYAQKYADHLKGGDHRGFSMSEVHNLVLKEQNKDEHDDEFSEFWEREMDRMMFRDMVFDQHGDMPASDIFLEAFDTAQHGWFRSILERYLVARERWIEFVKGKETVKELLISDMCFLGRLEQLVRSGIRFDPENHSERIKYTEESLPTTLSRICLNFGVFWKKKSNSSPIQTGESTVLRLVLPRD